MSDVRGNIKYLSGSLGKEEEVDVREESLICSPDKEMVGNPE